MNKLSTIYFFKSHFGKNNIFISKNPLGKLLVFFVLVVFGKKFSQKKTLVLKFLNATMGNNNSNTNKILDEVGFSCLYNIV